MLPTTTELQRVVAQVQAAGVPTRETPAGIVVRYPSYITTVIPPQLGFSYQAGYVGVPPFEATTT